MSHTHKMKIANNLDLLPNILIGPLKFPSSALLTFEKRTGKRYFKRWLLSWVSKAGFLRHFNLQQAKKLRMVIEYQTNTPLLIFYRSTFININRCIIFIKSSNYVPKLNCIIKLFNRFIYQKNARLLAVSQSSKSN